VNNYLQVVNTWWVGGKRHGSDSEFAVTVIYSNDSQPTGPSQSVGKDGSRSTVRMLIIFDVGLE
jgi:hypothetical protein